MHSSRNSRSPITSRTGVAALLLTIIAVAAISLWRSGSDGREEIAGSDPRPRSTADREPRYVDDARCASCHEDIYDSFRAHPMGRSMALVPEPDQEDVGLFQGAQAFTAGEFRYKVIRRAGQVFHEETRLDGNGEPLATTTLPVAYAVGSAERGRSYLINRGGRLFMSPITWYPANARWDLSPGYEDRNSHFNRPVIVQCLFCHANRANPVEGSLATYSEPVFSGHAIGCQRCHGPGEDHVALHERSVAAEDLAGTIVNPAHLAPKLREAVCQQCHLSGAAKVLRRGKSHYDFRPGMPLEEVIRVFVDARGQRGKAKFVGHVEQMEASRCFQATGGEMGCISCHDPHAKPPPETRVDYFRSKCLDCHQVESCTEAQDLRHAAGDNCVACHMPARGTEIRHAAITDHRILRRPADAPASREADAAGAAARSIVPFHPPAEGDLEIRRDRALALLRMEDGDDVALDEAELRRTARDLQDAVERHADDLEAWEGLGVALMRSGDPEQAMRCFESVLRQSPRREFSLRNAATLAKSLGRPDVSYVYWQEALAINPWIVRYRADAADALARLRRWADGEALCRQTLDHFPGSNRSRQLLIESLLAQGRTDEADREFQTWLRFRPADPDQLKQWYQNHPSRRQR